MADQQPSEIARPFFEVGMAKGQAKVILRTLDTFGVDLARDQRQAIGGCTDIDQLDVLFDSALKLIAAHNAFEKSLEIWLEEQSPTT